MGSGKSKRNAFVLSCATVLSYSATSAVLNILVPYWISGDIRAIVANPESLEQPANVLALISVVILLLGLLSAIGAFWLYKFFSEAHYGKRGAMRWALFGFLFAGLMWLVDWLLGERSGLLEAILQFASLFGAYFAARWIVPLRPAKASPVQAPNG